MMLYAQCCRVFVLVEAASRALCDGAGRRAAVISRQSGYLSGVWAAETGCGTVDSPWQVRVHPGQRVNVTVFDFTVAAPPSGNATSPAAVVHGDPAAGLGMTSNIRPQAINQSNQSHCTDKHPQNTCMHGLWPFRITEPK